jgi:transcriptional regulator with XRE-family HTH domain
MASHVLVTTSCQMTASYDKVYLVSRIAMTLRSARLRAGMTREALAYHSGLTVAAIAQIESGRRQEVRLSSLRALAEAMAVSVDYLVCGPEAMGTKLFDHAVLMYGSEDDFLTSVAPFLAEGVSRSDVTLAVTTPSRIALLRDALDDDARHVEFADSDDWYRSPRDALTRYQVFVSEKFAQGAPWVRIIGEPVWTGRTAREIREWTRYESLLNVFFASSPATIICPYDVRSAPAGALACGRNTHPRLVAGGNHRGANADYHAPEAVLVEGPGKSL